MSEIKIRNSSEKLRVENVFCVGKNYVDHIKEFDTPEAAAEIPKKPVIFMKPNSSVMCNDINRVSIPVVNGEKISHNLQNEVELVIVIGKGGKNISIENAVDHVFGFAVGIDFTLRDLQNEQKKKSLPWATSKGFYTSAPVSEIVRKEDIPFSTGDDTRIWLEINGEVKQDSKLSLMIFKPEFIVHYLSQIFMLSKGDLIFTGTPAGITKLNPGDKVNGFIESIGEVKAIIE